MFMRTLAVSLLASTALATVAYAQSAQPAQQAAGAAAQPTTNIGEIQAQEAPKPVLKQKGMTASPTDFAAEQNKSSEKNQASTSSPAQMPGIGSGPVRETSPGGVTGQDLGGGYMIKEEAKKTRSTVTRDAIDKQGPSANPYQLIELLPGVVMSSTDNTGANGGNIRLRGFNSDKVGMTIEGMPVNDSGNYALYPQEYVDSENIEQISIAQGSPDLDSPHIGSVGGVINLYFRDPAKEAGGYASTSLGSDGYRRFFVRGETGQVGAVRAFMSYSNLAKDNWAGPGGDERHHVDFKGVWDISKGNTVRFSAMYNDAQWQFYRQPTLADFNKPGYKPGYLPNLPSSYFNTTSPVDQSANSAFDYYKYRINPFRNLVLSAPSNFTLSENLKFDTVPYFWYGFGNGGGTSTLQERTAGSAAAGGSNNVYSGNIRITGVDFGTPAGVVNGDKYLYYNPSITETYRPGVINKFTYDAGNHKIVAGHWYEYASHRQTAPLFALNNDGSVDDPFGERNALTLPSSAKCYTSPNAAASGSGTAPNTEVTCPTGPLQRRDQKTTTTTNMVFAGDTWDITNWLTLDYGVKHVWVDRNVENYLPDATTPNKTLKESETLPTIGATLKLNQENKVFASFATSFRSAPNFTLVSSYNLSNGAYTPVIDVEPEHGRSYEIGHRYQGSLFATSISAFYGDFENYQQTVRRVDPSAGPGSSPVTQTINIGDVRNYGINAEIGTAPIYNFRPYVSAEYLRTEILENGVEVSTTVAGVNDYLRTAGKELPGAPRYSFGVGLDYDNGHLFGNLSYKWLDDQYATLMNDEKLEAFGRLNATVGYRFADVQGFKQPTLKLNLYNLMDARQLTGIAGGGNTYTAATTGVNGKAIAAQAGSNAPAYYMGEGFSATVTLSTGF